MIIYALQLIMFLLKLSAVNTSLLLDLMVPVNPRLQDALTGFYYRLKARFLSMGMDTNDDDLIWDIRKKIGMVFQNPDNQIVSSMVEDEVAFGPENIGIENPELRKE